MPFASVNAGAPVRLFYELHHPPVQEHGRCFLCTGFQTEGYSWKSQLDVLLQHGYTCVTFDNRGCGRSGRPRYRYTTKMLARDAMELLSKELAWNPSEVHLISISMGGMYALEMMAGLHEGAFSDISGTLDGRCFLSATLMVTQSVGWRRPSGLVPAKLLSTMASSFAPGLSARAKMYRAMEQAFSREWLRADSGQTHPKTGIALTNGQVLARRGAAQYHAKVAEGVPPTNGWAAFLAQAAAVATHHIAPHRLERLAQSVAGVCPVLVVCAGRDRLVPYRAQLHLAEALKPAVVRVVDLPDRCHAVTEESAVEVNAALLGFIGLAERRLPERRCEPERERLAAGEGTAWSRPGGLGCCGSGTHQAQALGPRYPSRL